MSGTNAHVSSVALEELQSSLRQLSERLTDCKELVDTATKKVHEHWDDDKFREFEEVFKPYREQIIEIAQRYEDWAVGYLEERIKIVKELETLKI